VSTLPPAEALALYRLRYSRRCLRVEQKRIAHWRRLLRARIDLIVAAAVPPDLLGQDDWGVLPASAERDLPDHLDLVCALSDGRPADFDRLGELLNLDRRLASYEGSVSLALAGCTEELIRALAANPASSLQDVHLLS
jgi:hypothetical protein